jgi:hypothetical protein
MKVPFFDFEAMRTSWFLQTANMARFDYEDWRAVMESTGTWEQLNRCTCGKCDGVQITKKDWN